MVPTRNYPIPSSQKIQLFNHLVGDQILEAAVREWDRLTLAEAAHDKILSSAKSLFLDFKIGDQVVDAAWIDEGLRADMK